MPQQPETGTPPPRDLYEAVSALVEARGTPEEGDAWLATRQRLAERRAIPGESEGSARWRIAQAVFDEVSRAAEADARFRGERIVLARFTDLPDDMQGLVVSGLGGVFAQFAQIARKHAS